MRNEACRNIKSQVHGAQLNSVEKTNGYNSVTTYAFLADTPQAKLRLTTTFLWYLANTAFLPSIIQLQVKRILSLALGIKHTNYVLEHHVKLGIRDFDHMLL